MYSSKLVYFILNDYYSFHYIKINDVLISKMDVDLAIKDLFLNANQITLLNLWKQGFSNKEIGKKLEVSEDTIKGKKKRMAKKIAEHLSEEIFEK